MDIQFEVQKIHSQFGTTEMANYQIQKLFDKLVLEDRAEQLRKHAVVGRSEQLLEEQSNWLMVNTSLEVEKIVDFKEHFK